MERQAAPHAAPPRRRAGLTLANRITIFRILMIPPFIITLLGRHYELAFLMGALMGLSDAADGFVARNFRQRSRLGSFLDPLADKLFLLSTYAALAHTGDVPAWVFIILLSKDVAVSVGWALLFVMQGSHDVITLFVGKAATAAQMAYAALLLLVRAFAEGTALAASLPFLQAAMVALTAFSLLEYLRLGTQRLAKD